MPYESSVQDCHFTWPCPVYYEDTDGQGFLYHSRCMNYFERARSEWLRALGIRQSKLLELNQGFVVSKASLDYHRPAFFEDQLTATVNLLRLRRTSMQLSQVLFKGKDAGEAEANKADADDAMLIVSAQFQIAFIDTSALKPIAMPEAVFEAFSAIKLP